MGQPLDEDAVAQDIESQLLLAIEIGGSRKAQVSGADGIDDILRRLGDLTDQLDEPGIFATFTQMPVQIDMKFVCPPL